MHPDKPVNENMIKVVWGQTWKNNGTGVCQKVIPTAERGSNYPILHENAPFPQCHTNVAFTGKEANNRPTYILDTAYFATDKPKEHACNY